MIRRTRALLLALALAACSLTSKSPLLGAPEKLPLPAAFLATPNEPGKPTEEDRYTLRLQDDQSYRLWTLDKENPQPTGPGIPIRFERLDTTSFIGELQDEPGSYTYLLVSIATDATRLGIVNCEQLSPDDRTRWQITAGADEYSCSIATRQDLLALLRGIRNDSGPQARLTWTQFRIEALQ